MTTNQPTRPIKRILIRCDGAPEIGFGHVVRCLALADELRDLHGCEVSFAMLQGPLGVAQVQEHGYVVHQPAGQLSETIDEGAWLQRLARDTGTQALILDVRTDLAVEAIQQIRGNNVLIATIDDPSDRRLAADLAFYPPVPQVEKFDWTGFCGKRFVGWDWVLLRLQFAEAARRNIPRAPDSLSEPPGVDRLLTLLVTMGGSDPAGLTLMALEAIEKIDGNFRVLVAIGGGFMHEPALTAWLATAKRSYEIRRDVTDMASLMAEADLAIASFGVTAYELAAIGVPAIYVCVTEDHAEAARALVAERAAISMGHHQKTTPADLARVLNHAIREDYSSRIFGQPTRCIDGLAAERIASIVASPCSIHVEIAGSS